MGNARFDQRPSGINGVGELPWGSHFGVFYASEKELLDALVPFLAEGLSQNERCSWEVRAPLTVEAARRALAEALPDLARYEEARQLQLIPAPDATASQQVLDEALERRLDEAILEGFDGLRLVRHADDLVARGLETVARLNVLAAFVYPRAGLGAARLMEIVQDHRFALVCNAGRWEVLEGSEARMARDALRRSEEKLQTLFSNMSEGFAYHRIILDASGRPRDYVFLEVNAAFERLTGLRAEAIVGKRVTEVIPGIASDSTGWIGRYGHVALTGEPTQFESRSAALGKWYAVSAFSHQRGYFAVTFRDVTDKRIAEQALRASEARFKLLSDSAGLLLATDNPQGVVSSLCLQVMEHLDCQAFFNFLADPAVGKLRLNAWAGITEEEARGIAWLDFGASVCGCAARDRQRLVVEDVQRSSDERTALVRSYGMQAYCCHPLIAEGRLLGTLSFGTRTRARFSDEEVALMKTVADQVAVAMERIQTQEALRAANAQLVTSDQRKNDFLATLSHELRNPLAPITNSLYILDHAPPGGEQASRARQIIARQVAQLSSLVNDLLDVTRITRNKVQLQRERLELNEVARRAVEDNRSFFDGAGVRLELEPAPRPVQVIADRTRIAQIIGNLLQNAAKFTPRGGRTRVALGVEGTEAAVRVVDDGVGMSPETLAGLFRPFVQADQTLDRSKGGLGLGLALVKGLVELHGGNVSARSDGFGKGAEFLIRLPLDTGSALQAAPDRAPAAGARRRILIIEDNVDAADSLRELLELSGHQVEVAYSGPDGLARARALEPEVVLCDIGLPGMDGYEVARAFRADEALRARPLIALSGYALPEDLQRAADAGFDRHLAKPPSLDKLEELLANLSALRRTMAGAD